MALTNAEHANTVRNLSDNAMVYAEHARHHRSEAMSAKQLGFAREFKNHADDAKFYADRAAFWASQAIAARLLAIWSAQFDMQARAHGWDLDA